MIREFCTLATVPAERGCHQLAVGDGFRSLLNAGDGKNMGYATGPGVQVFPTKQLVI